MNEHNPEPAGESEDRRRQTERKLRQETIPVEEMSETEIAVAIHELRVRQVELQMQNEELRRAQTELEQSRTKYAELFDFAPVGYLVFDAGGLVVEANLTAASLLGWERSVLLRRSFSLHVAPAGRDTWRLHHAAVFKAGKSQEGEIEVVGRNETRRVVRLHSRPVMSEGGKVVQCRTAMSDVTALVRTEQRLRDSERRFRTLAENAPDIILRVDAETHIVYANKQVEHALGLPVEEVVGCTLGELEAPVDLVETWRDAVEQVFRTARTSHTEFHSISACRRVCATTAPPWCRNSRRIARSGPCS